MADPPPQKSPFEFAASLLRPRGIAPPPSSAPPNPVGAPVRPSGGTTPAAKQLPKVTASAPHPPRTSPVAARGVTTLVGECCARCNVVVVRPEIAIVCQGCHRFFVPVRLWHGVVAVFSVLAAIFVYERTGGVWIPLVVGLVIAQLLLFATIRSLDRRIVLFIASLVLIPSSISMVALSLGFHAQLPAFLRVSIAWVSVLCFLGLAVQLFVRWWSVGVERGLSKLRILGTFSVALSCLALVLFMILATLPVALAPQDPGIVMVRHILEMRVGVLFLWLTFVGVLAMPGTFNRPITILQQVQGDGITGSLVDVVALCARVIQNLALELIDGAKEIIAICRVAFASVGRSLIFLTSVTGLQVSFCLLIDSYLRYMVTRETPVLHLTIAVVLLVTMLPALFWSATVASFSEILVVTSNTLAIPGLAVVLCASIASWSWFTYEIFTHKSFGMNWFAIFTVAAVFVEIAVVVISRKESDASQ